MNLIFIRHGQGEHTVNLPGSLNLKNPSLTNLGVRQAKLLREQFPLNENDVILISPTKRTLQTAFTWSKNIDCGKIVSPFVSPRMFPILPGKDTLPCDEMMEVPSIIEEFPAAELQNIDSEIWCNGINMIPEYHFAALAGEFIQYCKGHKKERIYIVSHDGTITSYRQILTGSTLTRNDFPVETGWFELMC
ncbi:histidine phosphatase family protein [Peribacillus sp. SCS-37]|uniref:histidine phosphatase family protein n=1 Tax=Paraperibacillus esterisolvens TaxID=3115296 RepID=UPI003905B593